MICVVRKIERGRLTLYSTCVGGMVRIEGCGYFV